MHELPEERSMQWFEVTAAASAFIPHVLLALASEPDCTDEDVARAHDAYFPWMSLAIVMLDSYVDRQDDAARGGHSYFAYYGDEQTAITRLIATIRHMQQRISGLQSSDRHAVIGSCMVAMYLSKASAFAPASRQSTQQIIGECDGLTRVVLPALGAWRLYRAIASWWVARLTPETGEDVAGSGVGRC
jgi:hypothetical protein